VIKGVHAIVFSRDAEADREFFRDVLGWDYVDAHDGWLIFAQPPAELAIHPWTENSIHRLYLMSDDLEGDMASLQARGVEFTGPAADQGFGKIAGFHLPGGGELHLYQPAHQSPLAAFAAAPDGGTGEPHPS
jgi:catechol 2,3-dioxygenase-like lactoylglutathione lyase family enzyme